LPLLVFISTSVKGLTSSSLLFDIKNHFINNFRILSPPSSTFISFAIGANSYALIINLPLIEGDPGRVQDTPRG
jgi:hypothetical protein